MERKKIILIIFLIVVVACSIILISVTTNKDGINTNADNNTNTTNTNPNNQNLDNTSTNNDSNQTNTNEDNITNEPTTEMKENIAKDLINTMFKNSEPAKGVIYTNETKTISNTQIQKIFLQDDKYRIEHQNNGNTYIYIQNGNTYYAYDNTTGYYWKAPGSVYGEEATYVKYNKITQLGSEQKIIKKEIINGKETIQIEVQFENEKYKIWYWEQYAIPIKVEQTKEDGKIINIEMKDIRIGEIDNTYFNPPANKVKNLE